MASDALPVVHAMHWDNIDPRLIDGQRRVFEALHIPLQQHRAHRVEHGEWMNDVIRQQPDDAVLVFCDIDAFPLQAAAYQRAVEFARQGGVFGLAQYSNHKPTVDLYAGPMFLAFSKSLWQALGSPSMKRSKTGDAAEALTLAARAQGQSLHLVKPTACIAPKWALKDQGVFGIGTFYGEAEFFHLFESREPAHETLFLQVVEDVVAQRPLQFGVYLQIMSALHAQPLPWWRRLLSCAKG